MRTGRSVKLQPTLKGVAAALAFATSLALAGCSSSAETEGERAGNRVKDDVRGTRAPTIAGSRIFRPARGARRRPISAPPVTTAAS